MENNEFLNRFQGKLDNGEYDKDLSLPFMKKELLYATVENKVKEKIEEGTGTGLSENEIKDAIEEVKETAGGIFYLMVKHKLLEQREDGTFGLSKKGAIAIGEVSRKKS